MIASHRVRLAAIRLGIQKIDATDTQIMLHFRSDAPIDPLKLIELVQKQRHIRFSGQDKLKIETRGADVSARVDTLKGLFRALA